MIPRKRPVQSRKGSSNVLVSGAIRHNTLHQNDLSGDLILQKRDHLYPPLVNTVRPSNQAELDSTMKECHKTLMLKR